MILGADFIHFSIATSHDVQIRGSQAGTGPPLLLLHGYPQTHLIWHKIAEQLTSQYRVIALDLRGYGQSSKPADVDGSHKTYAKSTLAKDIATVMDRLNYPRYVVCGHDRGGRVAHKLAVDYPDRVTKLMVLDIAPTLVMYETVDQEFATKYWHWFFLIQPPPFPEQAILGNPEAFATKCLGGLPGSASGIFHPDALKAYSDLFKDRQGVHAMCEDYRAASTIDLDEQRDDIKNGRKIQCPTRVLWGSKGLIGKKYDAVAEWKKVCSSEVSGEALESGHYIPEEAPEALLEQIKSFFN
jgi:haloacetate dehalogenase